MTTAPPEQPLRILVDVCHPAHAHFFRHPISLWQEHGHVVSVASRDKDVALPLMAEFGIASVTLATPGKGAAGLLSELSRRDLALWRYARSVKADVITAIGGIFAAHAALAARIPSVVFYDTEIATLQNLLTYPLATRVVVPRCYSAWTPSRRTIRYPGYHELSYLHPSRFTPDRARAVSAGLAADRPTYLVRLVAWTANHDIGDSGLSPGAVRAAVEKLSSHGKVIISSEGALPDDLGALRYGGRVSDIHHLMAHCAGYFGESATMASECAVLGVPAVYAAHSHRGYTDEQESRYGLVRNLRALDPATVAAAAAALVATRVDPLQRQAMLDECVDVAAFACETVEGVARAGRR